MYAEVRDETFGPFRRVEDFGRIWKKFAHRITRRDGDVTDRADARRRPLSGEELIVVTLQARRVLWVFSDIRKPFLARANLFPVRRGKLVTRVALLPVRLRVVIES